MGGVQPAHVGEAAVRQQQQNTSDCARKLPAAAAGLRGGQRRDGFRGEGWCAKRAGVVAGPLRQLCRAPAPAANPPSVLLLSWELGEGGPCSRKARQGGWAAGPPHYASNARAWCGLCFGGVLGDALAHQEGAKRLWGLCRLEVELHGTWSESWQRVCLSARSRIRMRLSVQMSTRCDAVCRTACACHTDSHPQHRCGQGARRDSHAARNCQNFTVMLVSPSGAPPPLLSLCIGSWLHWGIRDEL